ncbi:uncharacterized protein BBOV_IV006040 [Babesia bovis T2Bo]|uniref:Uncharacterized protein n=1 Tax=Babesia bovis TaxID=5865 RepID=A7AQZ6_BABBO|nr:uncharacterized protein BBOV_IV006040 [Babesia bovis T2Bo]EDO06965.1 hypothetical protein BBOV_IV006040 [Babesia bovis T2Bo]|eukprot:XP_001610533.1 hypothetical protein [Babesia bovis T2Bo]
MDIYSGNLSADLLDITNRYLNACKLKSYILPLPFCDETVLNRRSVLAKVLSNPSCLGKKQLFEVLKLLLNDGFSTSNKRRFTAIYDNVIEQSRPVRSVRKASPRLTSIRSTLRQSSASIGDRQVGELASMHEPFQIAHQLDATIHQLSKSDTVGFVMIIASEQQKDTDSAGSNPPLMPVAGSLVEILDPEEHCIRALWCDPRLLQQKDAEFGKIVMLRTLGHIFDYGYPGAPANNKLKHTSVLNVLGILFPSAVYIYMINVLRFGKHFETEYNGGSHDDSSSHFCRCQRLSETPGAVLFWGISESRLKSIFYHIRTQIPTRPSELIVDALGRITHVV